MRFAGFSNWALIVVTVITGTVRADEPDRFATIVYESKSGAYWFSYGMESKEKAESEASKRATDRSNLVISTFKNCYCALALAADGKTFGVGSGDGPLIAQQIALKECRKKSRAKSSIILTLHTAQGIGGDSYFAIAFSPSTGRYGVAVAKASKSEAESEAIARCGASDAKAVAATKNGAIALALGKNKSVFGVGTAETEKEAQEMALDACKKKTTDCTVVVTLSSKK